MPKNKSTRENQPGENGTWKSGAGIHPRRNGMEQKRCMRNGGSMLSPRGEGLKKVVVVHLTHARGHCIAFWPRIPPLQVAPSFACSVASLSRSPGHQLPGCHSLRRVILADYLLGQGGPSTCLAGHGMFQSTPTPNSHQGNRRLDTPSKRSLVCLCDVWHACNSQVFMQFLFKGG